MKQSYLRASGYRRVSMREQVDGHSLEAQDNNIRKFVADQGWEFVEMYTDAGISAKRGSHRPDLNRLIQDAQAGKFDVIVVDKIDRFYRYLNGLLTTLDTLNQSGVSFASVREKLDFTTPWGKLMLTVLGMLAEIYIDNLRQETRKGLHQRTRNGLWNGSIPLGYCSGLCSQCTDSNGKNYCPEFGKPDKSANNVLIAHPVESKAVLMAFQSYLTGEFSDGKVTEKLNASYIETPDGTIIPFRQKGRQGLSQPGPFRRDTIRDMLNRVFYTGKVPYYGINKSGKKLKRKNPVALYPGQHPAIIDDVTFNAVQELRFLFSTNPRLMNGHKVRIYPLTGILRCGYCGLPFRGVSNNGKRYYRDVTHIERMGECPQSLLVAENIENQVVEYLRKSIQNTSLETSMKNVQRQIEAAEARFDRAKELFLKGELERERFETERVRKEILVGDLRSVKPNAILTCIDTIRQHIDRWDRILPIEQKRLFRLVLETVFIQDNALWEINPEVAYLSVLPVLSHGRENRVVRAGTTGMVQSSSNWRGTGFLSDVISSKLRKTYSAKALFLY